MCIDSCALNGGARPLGVSPSPEKREMWFIWNKQQESNKKYLKGSFYQSIELTLTKIEEFKFAYYTGEKVLQTVCWYTYGESIKILSVSLRIGQL